MMSLLPMLTMVALGGTLAPGSLPAERALHRALTEAVHERAALPEGAQLEIGELRIADRALLERALRLSGVELPPNERGLPRVSARARFVLRGGGEAWTWVSAPVAATVPVVVAARPLERGRPMVAGDLSIAMESLRPGQLASVSEAVGKAPRRDLREGEALSEGWLSTPSVLERGDSVEVRLHEGALSIRARGETLERGAVGDDVRVRIGMTGRVVRARVVDSTTVEVMP
ncbi:MAG: flagellar basal body P-ring formation chaperone FlgA [Myxococcota bacterium]